MGCAISGMVFSEHNPFTASEKLWSTVFVDSHWTHIVDAKLPGAVCKRITSQPVPTGTQEELERGVGCREELLPSLLRR